MLPDTSNAVDASCGCVRPPSLLDELKALLRTAEPPKPIHHSVPTAFQTKGDAIVLMQPLAMDLQAYEGLERCSTRVESAQRELLAHLIERQFLRSACHVGINGVAAVLAHVSTASALGARVSMFQPEYQSACHAYIGEAQGRVLLTCDAYAHFALANLIERSQVFAALPIGHVTAGGLLLSWEGKRVLQAPEVNSVY